MHEFSQCYEPLSPAERGVIKAMFCGHTSNNDIAETLGISSKTAQTHMGHIYAKLFVNDRVALLLYVLRAGWFDCYGNEVNTP